MPAVADTRKEEKMDQAQLAITIKTAMDTQWGPRAVDGQRRAFTADELDALADFRRHWPDGKRLLAAAAKAMRPLWRTQANGSVAPTALAVSQFDVTPGPH
jgi:hypothetical protein